jgi:cytochrome c oxidase cbb3-type subunit 3
MLPVSVGEFSDCKNSARGVARTRANIFAATGRRHRVRLSTSCERIQTLAILTTISAISFALVTGPSILAQRTSTPDGAGLYAANCGSCHGSDGRSGERAANIATRREVIALSDESLMRIVENGVPGQGMPSFGFLGRDQVSAIVRRVRELQGVGTAAVLSGDPRVGEAIFFGKAACSKCHMLNGRGSYQASDLSGYGQGRSAQELRKAILDPDRKLDPAAQSVTVVDSNGVRLTGVIRAQDNFSLVLQTDDGVFHTFARERMTSVEYSGHSTMPRNYRKRLMERELDDLVSYIMKIGDSEKKTARDSDE